MAFAARSAISKYLLIKLVPCRISVEKLITNTKISDLNFNSLSLKNLDLTHPKSIIKYIDKWTNLSGWKRSNSGIFKFGTGTNERIITTKVYGKTQ